MKSYFVNYSFDANSLAQELENVFLYFFLKVNF